VSNAIVFPALWVPEFKYQEREQLPSQIIYDLCNLLSSCSKTRSGNGFSVNPLGNPYVETVKFAASICAYIEILGFGGMVAEFKNRCLDYVGSLKIKDSGFANYAGGPACIFSTYYSLCTLKMLGGLDSGMVSGCASFLKSNVDGGGVPVHDCFPPDTTNCFWGVVSSSLVEDPKAIYGDAPLSFLRACQNHDGSYSTMPSATQSGRLQATVEALIIRRLMRDDPTSAEAQKICAFVKQCVGQWGKFGECPNQIGSPRDTIFGSIGLYLILGDSPPLLTTRFAAENLWYAHASLVHHLAVEGRCA
jgi:hypothetical protein